MTSRDGAKAKPHDTHGHCTIWLWIFGHWFIPWDDTQAECNEYRWTELTFFTPRLTSFPFRPSSSVSSMKWILLSLLSVALLSMWARGAFLTRKFSMLTLVTELCLWMQFALVYEVWNKVTWLKSCCQLTVHGSCHKMPEHLFSFSALVKKLSGVQLISVTVFLYYKRNSAMHVRFYLMQGTIWSSLPTNCQGGNLSFLFVSGNDACPTGLHCIFLW